MIKKYPEVRYTCIHEVRDKRTCRVELDIRNAFWDSAKSTIILIRVATGWHLNVRAYTRYFAREGIIRRDFCESHLCSAHCTENRTGKSFQAKATSDDAPDSANIRRVVTNAASCE